MSDDREIGIREAVQEILDTMASGSGAFERECDPEADRHLALMQMLAKQRGVRPSGLTDQTRRMAPELYEELLRLQAKFKRERKQRERTRRS